MTQQQTTAEFFHGLIQIVYRFDPKFSFECVVVPPADCTRWDKEQRIRVVSITIYTFSRVKLYKEILLFSCNITLVFV